MKSLNFFLALAVMVTLTGCQKAAETMTTPTETKTVAVQTNMPADENMEVFSASYADYQADEAQGQKHILFFHADWCPTCVKWEGNITENMGALGEDVVIYKTDYDTSDDLKLQYEITKQSMAVFVKADGSVAKKEADPSIESINNFFADDRMEMGTIQEDEMEVSETFSAIYTDFEAGAGEGQKHVLFFHAPWCPTCVKWEGKVTAGMDDLNENVVIYKTDYDTSDDLKTQYEITKQSTAVFINADGSVAKKEMDPSIESLNTFFSN